MELTAIWLSKWLLMLLRMVIEFRMENKTESSGKGSRKSVITFLGSWFLGMLEVKIRSLQSEDFKQHGVHVVELGARANWWRGHCVKRLTCQYLQKQRPYSLHRA